MKSKLRRRYITFEFKSLSIVLFISSSYIISYLKLANIKPPRLDIKEFEANYFFVYSSGFDL